MKRFRLSHLVVAGALFAVAAAAPLALAADVLRIGSFTPVTGVNNVKSVPAFIEAVEAASNGALTIEHYPGGSLGPSPVAQLKLVEDGVADIAEVVASYTPGRFPELSIFELPFLADNNLEGGLAAWEMYERGYLSGFEDLMLVGIIESGPYGIHGNFPINSLDDLRGKKIRAAGPIQGEIVRRLGAVPVGNIPATQIAESISRGLLDGTLMTISGIYGFGIAEVATHHLPEIELGSVSVPYPMRRDRYEALSPEAKAAFDEYAGAWFTRVLGENLNANEAEFRGTLASDPTHTIYTWSVAEMNKARALLAGIEAEWDQPNAAGVNLYQELQQILADVRIMN
ncbi:MAG: TRAP transporter substrate-binding protein [Alphaproteobacteria bacterium]